MSWLTTWLARRAMRRKVDWSTCEWSPQKAGQRRLKETLVRHYTEMAHIQVSALERSILMRMREADLIRETSRIQHERTMQEYRKEYEIYRKRMWAEK